MLEWLRRELGIGLVQNSRMKVPGGATVAVDGTSEDPPLLCKAYGRLERVAGTTLLAELTLDQLRLIHEAERQARKGMIPGLEDEDL